ncbi:hypothetical protein K3495_g772 [Podosphaera aphanis]|nr:hypothetical protein K3495_g772 [Podosphaera aphanis]
MEPQTQKTARSLSVTSTASTNSTSDEMTTPCFLELTMPNHHRTTSTASSDFNGGFLQLTPTTSNQARMNLVLTNAEERQRLLLLRARNN